MHWLERAILSRAAPLRGSEPARGQNHTSHMRRESLMSCLFWSRISAMLVGGGLARLDSRSRPSDEARVWIASVRARLLWNGRRIGP